MKKILLILLTVCSVVVHGQLLIARDADAQSFISRGSYEGNVAITNTGTTVWQGGEYVAGILELVGGYKRNNLWTKNEAVYPSLSGPNGWVLGGLTGATVGSAAYQRALLNLKGTTYTMSGISGVSFPDMRNEGIRFGFSSANGSGTASANAALNTNVPQNFAGNFNNVSIGYYSMNNINNVNQYTSEMGLNQGGGSQAQMYMRIKYSFQPNVDPSVRGYSEFSIGTRTGSNNSLVSNTAGYFLITRRANDTTHVFRNDTRIIAYQNTTVLTPVSNLMYLGAENFSNSAFYHTNRTCGFSTIGYGKTAAEVATEYEIINTFFRNIGRPTY